MAAARDQIVLPPPAEKIQHTISFGAVTGENRGDDAAEALKFLDDPYFWMRDDERKDERVLSRLRLENEYAKEATKHLTAFQDQLYEELKSKVKETDVSVPCARGPWQYFTRSYEGLG